MGIDFLAEEIGTRLRKKGMKCSTVTLTIKNEYFSSIQRQRPRTPPTDISREIADTAYAILREVWCEGNPIRMLTVTATNLTRAEYVTEQLNMFDSGGEEKRLRSKKREETVDKIRQKYGSGAILSGSVMSSDLGIYDVEKNASAGGDDGDGGWK